MQSVVSIDQFSEEDLTKLFKLAERFLADKIYRDPVRPHRIAAPPPDSKLQGRNRILATLFYESSTRTRLSFESAMTRLGGKVLSTPDSTSSSTSKGESIADTVRVVENYADIIIIRHPKDGASRVAAEYCSIPVVNAGDGSHEHPTQTLCDLFTLWKSSKANGREVSVREAISGMNVVLCGDLFHGRTVHSLAYALARFGARIIPAPADKNHDFPDYVRKRLLRDFKCEPSEIAKHDGHKSLPADVVYVTPDGSHQPTLFNAQYPNGSSIFTTQIRASGPFSMISSVDIVYQTRLQKERMRENSSAIEYPQVNAEFLKHSIYAKSKILHPLPRVDELSYDIDGDHRSEYFRQASYGVPVRMALISALLKLEGFESGLSGAPVAGYDDYAFPDSIRCENENCVSNANQERVYLKRKFALVDHDSLRCRYCDWEQQPKYQGDVHERVFAADRRRHFEPHRRIFFASEDDAVKAGFQLFKSRKARSSKAKTSISN